MIDTKYARLSPLFRTFPTEIIENIVFGCGEEFRTSAVQELQENGIEFCLDCLLYIQENSCAILVVDVDTGELLHRIELSQTNLERSYAEVAYKFGVKIRSAETGKRNLFVPVPKGEPDAYEGEINRSNCC